MIAVIRKLLETRLAALVPEWPTAWENVEFTPTPGVAHQRVALLPAAPVTITALAQGPSLLTGIFQVIVAVPPEGGPGIGDARADVLVGHFPRGLSLSDGSHSVWVPERAAVARAIQEENFRLVPVSVPWNLFASNS